MSRLSSAPMSHGCMWAHCKCTCSPLKTWQFSVMRTYIGYMHTYKRQFLERLKSQSLGAETKVNKNVLSLRLTQLKVTSGAWSATGACSTADLSNIRLPNGLAYSTGRLLNTPQWRSKLPTLLLTVSNVNLGRCCSPWSDEVSAPSDCDFRRSFVCMHVCTHDRKLPSF